MTNNNKKKHVAYFISFLMFGVLLIIQGVVGHIKSSGIFNYPFLLGGLFIVGMSIYRLILPPQK